MNVLRIINKENFNLKGYVKVFQLSKHFITTNASDKEQVLKEFLSKYANVIKLLNKSESELASKESSIIYLNNIYNEFYLQIKKKTKFEEEILLDWKSDASSSKLKEITLLLKLINGHSNYKRLTSNLMDNLNSYNRKELAFIFKLYTNLNIYRENTAKPELIKALESNLVIDSKSEIDNYDLFDLKNVYLGNVALNNGDKLLERTCKYLNEILIFNKYSKKNMIEQFNIEQLDKEIFFDNNLYYKYDFELNSFLWTKLDMFAIYQFNFPLEDTLLFLTEFDEQLRRLNKIENTSESFISYKTNLLGRYYKLVNDLGFQNIKNNRQFELTIFQNFKTFQNDYLKNLHLIENYVLLDSSIKLFLTLDEDFQKEKLWQTIEFYEDLLLKDHLETDQFYFLLNSYFYLRVKTFLNRKHQVLVKDNKYKLHMVPSEEVNLILDKLSTNCSQSFQEQIMEKYLKNLNEADISSLQYVYSTYYLVLNFSSAVGKLDIFENSIYNFITSYLKADHNSLPLVIEMVMLYSKNELTETKRIEICNLIKNSKPLELNLLAKHYIWVIEIVISSKMLLNENLNLALDIHDKASLFENFPTHTNIKLMERILENANEEQIKKSSKELISFVTKLMKKYTFEIHNWYFNENMNSELTELKKLDFIRVKNLIDDLVKMLINLFVKNDDFESLNELQQALAKNVDQIKLYKLFSNCEKYNKNLKFPVSLDFRLSALSKIIILTNCFMTKDLKFLWGYLYDLVNDLVLNKTTIPHPINKHLIEILSVFTHYDVLLNKYIYNDDSEILDKFKTSMSQLSRFISKDSVTTSYYLKYAQSLLSFNCFDPIFFEYILMENFAKKLVRKQLFIYFKPPVI